MDKLAYLCGVYLMSPPSVIRNLDRNLLSLLLLSSSDEIGGWRLRKVSRVTFRSNPRCEASSLVPEKKKQILQWSRVRVKDVHLYLAFGLFLPNLASFFTLMSILSI